MNIGFERIVPTPAYPVGTSAAKLKGKLWSSQAKVAKNFRDGLKISLRAAQGGLCCYCRRYLYDDYAVHIEHFVDKDSYPGYSYEIRNLALSCGTCNIKKNGYFSSLQARHRSLFFGYVGPRLPTVPTVKGRLPPSSPFPTQGSAFRWVSPHYHDYSQHIELVSTWVFRGVSAEGWRTIRGCKLNDLAKVEMRAYTERLHRQSGGLSDLVTDIESLSQEQATQALDNLASEIRRLRQDAVAGGGG